MSNPVNNDMDLLISLYLDGEIDQQGFSELNAWLKEDRAHVAYFVDRVADHCRTSELVSGEFNLPFLVPEQEGVFQDSSEPEDDLPTIQFAAPDRLTKQQYASAFSYVLRHTFTPKRIAGLATAAVLLLGVTLVFVLTGSADDANPTPDLAETPNDRTNEPGLIGTDNPSAPSIVATLTAERDAAWDRRPGQDLYAGQRITLNDGFAEITTARGAVAILEAPVTIELLDHNALHLHIGKLVGICETESSKGFVVRTEHAEITDIGTRFGVALDATGNLLAEVFDGRITIKPATDQSADALELTVGESASVDTRGRMIDPKRFSSDTFARLQAASQLAITLEGQVRWSTNVFAGQAQAEWTNDKRAMLVEELRDHTLQTDITLTHHEPGTHQSFKTHGSATIPAGTTIRSYLVIHAPGEAEGWNSVVQASVAFDAEILGIIANDRDWKGFVKATQTQAGVLKPNPRMYLESLGPDHPEESADLVQWNQDKRTLVFRILTSNQGVDAFRVIVREPTETTTP